MRDQPTLLRPKPNRLILICGYTTPWNIPTVNVAINLTINDNVCEFAFDIYSNGFVLVGINWTATRSQNCDCINV